MFEAVSLFSCGAFWRERVRKRRQAWERRWWVRQYFKRSVRVFGWGMRKWEGRLVLGSVEGFVI